MIYVAEPARLSKTIEITYYNSRFSDSYFWINKSVVWYRNLETNIKIQKGDTITSTLQHLP